MPQDPRHPSRPIRPWTGIAWSSHPTGDGRRIRPGAITGLDRCVRVIEYLTPYDGSDPGSGVGTVLSATETDGVGLVVGQTTLDPGVYQAGVSLADAVVECVDGVDVVTSGRLVEVFVGDRPCWPEAKITVHDVELYPNVPADDESDGKCGDSNCECRG